ncbi:hypothetical protein [Actinoplanes sp. NPDC051494]|uniref:hypothetical protein n=1 Tax=Actinoplanes sp. NPDC051494 TaxID=3363907 RepID=UPI00378B196D
MSQLKKLFRSVVNFSILLVGAAASVSQLLGLSKGWGRIILTGVGVSSLFFLVIRWWVWYFDGMVRRLKTALEERRSGLARVKRKILFDQAQIAKLQVGHQGYVEAIEHVVDKGESMFTERLVITVIVGADDDADRISERHETQPTGRITQRTFRPVLPYNTAPPIGVDEIGLRATLLENKVPVKALPLIKDGIFRVWLIFDPVLKSSTDWQVDYQTKRLWAPLRKDGTDSLVWTDRPPIDNGGSSVLSELVVRFVFPRDKAAPAVTERFGFGAFGDPVRIDGSDDWLIEFRDSAPAGRTYTWDLAQEPSPNHSLPVGLLSRV